MPHRVLITQRVVALAGRVVLGGVCAGGQGCAILFVAVVDVDGKRFPLASQFGFAVCLLKVILLHSWLAHEADLSHVLMHLSQSV